MQDFANVVTVLGFALAVVVFVLDQWDKKRRNLAFAMAALLVVVGFGLMLRARAEARTPKGGAVAVRPPGQQPLPDTPADSGLPFVPPDQPPEAGPSVPDTFSAEAEEPVEPPYHGWLRKQGMVIRYNAPLYMEGSCPGRVMAVGDFNVGGWTSGPPARCDPDGWISFDARQLVSAPRFIVGRTYCLNFVDESGRYGQHGSPPRAQGLSTIELPAKEGAHMGLNIGFRISRLSDGEYGLEFTNEGAAHCE